jgi:hypothetical protein
LTVVLRMRSVASRFSVLLSHLRPTRAFAEKGFGVSRVNIRKRGIATMAPTEPKAFEYIVIGGGSGGSGTVGIWEVDLLDGRLMDAG